MKRTICLLTAVCVVLAVITCVILIVTGKPSAEAPKFIPPKFDKNAVKGMPTVPDGLGWYEVYKTGMSFKASVCGEIRIANRSAKIYFTNHEQNTLWLKLRVLNANGDILAETGLLRPGEYLEQITFDTLPSDGEKIALRIMSYQPETYYSGGATTLNTVAQIEGEEP